MIIDRLEAFYAGNANNRKGPINVFRASSAGYCERRLGYDKLGYRGDPITPRRAAVFRHGNIIDHALKRDLHECLGSEFIEPGRDTCEIEGVKISFEPDGAFQHDGEIGIVENKTMNDYAFERALKGQIDRAYLCQAWVYAYGTSFNPVVFVAYRKETSHFAEVIFDRHAQQTVVTQRFGGDPREIYIKDPLLMAEIRTPFDGSVEEEVRGKFRRLAELSDAAGLAPRLVFNDRSEPIIQPETVSVQGAANAAAYANANAVDVATATKSGSWFKFATGRKILNFPCSYCSHVRRCTGASLEFENNKPKWVVAANGDGSATD